MRILVVSQMWPGPRDPDLGAFVAQVSRELERLELPRGNFVSGLESDGRETFFCGGGSSGKVRAVRARAGSSRAR